MKSIFYKLILVFPILFLMTCDEPSEKDTTPPSLSTLSISSDQIVGELVLIEINSNDDSGIAKIEIYVDNEIIDTDYDLPYEFIWNTTNHPDGNYDLKIVSVDEAGNSTEKIITNITIDNASFIPTEPSVSSIIWENDAFTIRWNQSSDSDFLEYQLEKSIEPAMNDYTVIYSTEDISNTFYSDPEVNTEIHYYYRVAVSDTVGLFNKSEIYKSPIRPQQINVLPLSYSNGELIALWDKAIEEDVSMYTLYIASNESMDSKTVLFQSVNKNDTSAVIPHDFIDESRFLQLDVHNTSGLITSSEIIEIVPFFNITSPTGGEQWEIGTSQPIYWESNYITDNINLVLNHMGDKYEMIAHDIPNSGFYVWNVDENLYPQENYTIQIESNPFPVIFESIGDGFTLYKYIEWVDFNFELLIRETLGKPTGAISTIELATITEIKGEHNGIQDISGIEYCTNLELLRLWDSRVEDLTPLSNLTSLKNIWLRDNNVLSDISPLSGLINLEELNFDVNQVSDLNPISKLYKLRVLGAEINEIEDLTPLTNLTNLTVLGLNDNRITDIYALSDMINLSRLALNANNISDINPIADIAKTLTLFAIGDNPVGDLSIIWTMFNLQELTLSNLNLTDLAPVASLDSLWLLNVRNNQITDISPILTLDKMVRLALDNNNISDITGIDQLTNLWELELHDNQVVDIISIVQNKGISDGDRLILRNNPLNTISVNTYIPELESRGVYVEY